MKVWPVVIAILIGVVLFALAMTLVNNSGRQPRSSPSDALRPQ
jgi:hypothetical protein